MQCGYCDKDFIKEFNNQVYCSIPCRTRMTNIKKKIRQKKHFNTIDPRKCIICGEMFHHYDMKKSCKKCLILLKENPYLYKTRMI